MGIDYGRKRTGVAVTDPLQIVANNLATVPTHTITPFVNRLRKELPDTPIVMYDERFTSTIAHQAMIDGGMKKTDRRDKARVDAIAATIILNDYLQSRFNPSNH